MERRAAASLLMLSLVALLLVGAATADDIKIRLPGDAVMEEPKLPFECCDIPRCTTAGWCGCRDVIKECGCNKCETVTGGFMCRDAAWFRDGDRRPPRCTPAGN